jgi:methylmalonyl-CoA mutase
LLNLRAERNETECQAALDALTKCVQTGEGNLLELAVEAAAKRASLGEISYACEKIVGRYKAVIRTISGVYSSEYKSDDDFKEAQALVARFAEKEGRQPRIMIAKMGQDGHDRGAKVVSTGYADIGFDVDIGPLFQTPAEAAKQAVENDVHVLGVSSLAAGHKTLVPQVINELEKTWKGRYTCNSRRSDTSPGLPVPVRCRSNCNIRTGYISVKGCKTDTGDIIETLSLVKAFHSAIQAV